MKYIGPLTLAQANNLNNFIFAKIADLVPPGTTQYAIPEKHPTLNQYIMKVPDRFIQRVQDNLTPQQLALIKTRAEVEALGWYPEALVSPFQVMQAQRKKMLRVRWAGAGVAIAAAAAGVAYYFL